MEANHKRSEWFPLELTSIYSIRQTEKRLVASWIWKNIGECCFSPVGSNHLRDWTCCYGLWPIYQPWHHAIAGCWWECRETDELVKMNSLVGELGISSMVTFVGAVEHEKMPTFYNAADICIVPSYHESFGLVAVEALASGTPVVAHASAVWRLSSMMAKQVICSMNVLRKFSPYIYAYSWAKMKSGNPWLRLQDNL